MRIISGLFKGRPLKAVPGRGTRPTTDKMKETIFNIIGPYFSGGVALDLFAGSGSLGIEAISRGMETAIFIDKDMKAIQTIKSNVSVCNIEQQCEIFRNDAERALHILAKRNLQFDCIFLDPPYHNQKLEKLLMIIQEKNMLTKDGFAVCEHSSNISLPEQIGNLTIAKKGDYGTTGLSIYQMIRNIEGDLT